MASDLRFSAHLIACEGGDADAEFPAFAHSFELRCWIEYTRTAVQCSIIWHNWECVRSKAPPADLHSWTALSNWLNWRDVGSRGELGVRRGWGSRDRGAYSAVLSLVARGIFYSADDGKPSTSGLPPSMVSAETPARLSR